MPPILNKKIFNSRAFISLSIFLLFTLLLITSLLMFAQQHTERTAMLHTAVGFALLLMVLWHIKNNILSLAQYCRLRLGSVQTRRNIAMPAAVLVAVTLLSLSLAQLPPVTTLYLWGSSLRAQEKIPESLHFTYERLNKTQADAQGESLSIDLRKGPYFMFPQYAIWLETLDGSFIQPLYITEKLAQNSFTNKVTQRNPLQVFTSNPLTSGQNSADIFHFEADPAAVAQRFRSESLPVFLHKVASRKEEEVLAPTGTTAATANSKPLAGVDAYSGATVLNNFVLSARTAKPLPESYRVRLEINQSFDFNEFYSSDRFPDDPVYSGNGYSAQPSVVYEAIVHSHSGQSYYVMQLIGRGHHSGGDGQIHRDMENLTTATQLIDRIIVETDRDPGPPL